MSGIYIHIPFCQQACHYCNFHFSTSLKLKDKLVRAITHELQLQKNYLSTPPQTLYFGGGTPSILNLQELSQILEAVNKHYATHEIQEVTMEVNPNDLTTKRLKEYKSLGINRLSIGIQSFNDQDLKFLNRAHNAQQASECISMAREAGFHNLSIDLIYGIPNVTDIDWERNILHALQLQIPHISCYCLTVEEKTALHHMIATNKVPNVSEEAGASQFALLMKLIKEHNYIHYEISNFCKDEWFSKHNTSYWQGKSYLGIGPSAHSFNGQVRQWNIANNFKYIESLTAGNIPAEQEQLTISQQLNEYIMTSLRTMWGCDLQYISERFGDKLRKIVENKAQKFITNNMMIHNHNVISLTTEGKMIADYITLEFFIVDE